MVSINYRGMLRIPANVVTALVLIAITPFGSPAQNASPNSNEDLPNKDYALIFGTVWGPDSRPVAGVPIIIRRLSEKKAKWELISDRRGEFAQRVPVGAQDYIVQADIKTAKGQPKPEVTVHIDNNERKDIGLHLREQDLPKK